MEKLLIRCKNGLGDKILDILGAYVLCSYMKYQLIVDFNGINSNWTWGNNHYDEKILNFENIEIVYNVDPSTYPIVLDIINPSVSLSPYNVWKFLIQNIPYIDFKEVCSRYLDSIKKILNPSEEIQKLYPENIENSYGVHLRHTDKILDKELDIYDDSHMMNVKDFKIFESKLVEDIEKIIIKESESSFFICSENKEYKLKFQNRVKDLGVKYNKKVNILECNYIEDDKENFNSILDMFCLSKCKEIYQNISYSTFSIVSAIVGNKNLINYSKYKKSYTNCIIHNWNGVISINSQYNYDFKFLERCNKLWNGIKIKKIDMEEPNSFFIVTKFPNCLSWSYSNLLTNTGVFAFRFENNIIYSYDYKVMVKLYNGNILFTTRIEEAAHFTIELDSISTHYRIKNEDKYIRHKNSALFCEKDDGTEQFKSDSIWNFIPNQIDKEHTFVIARYREDVNWVRYLPGKVIIYNKGNDSLSIDNLRGNISIINLPNLGREGHTYFHHIIENYDKLTERVTFLQGRPFDHSPDLLELCCMGKEFDDVQSLSTWYKNDHKESIPSKPIINLNLRYLNGARFATYPMNILGEFTEWKDPFWSFGINKYKYSKDPIRSYLEKSNMKDKIVGDFHMSIAALFSARRENIRKNSLQNYKDMMKQLLSSDQQGGFEVYILERIWYPLMK